MDLVKRAREYLAANAAESGADVLIAELADALEMVILDRARFPDRPDMVGRMIAASYGNMKLSKERADGYARDAMMDRDRVVRLLRDTIPALELAHSMKRGGPAKSNALALLNRVRAVSADDQQ